MSLGQRGMWLLEDSWLAPASESSGEGGMRKEEEVWEEEVWEEEERWKEED